MVIIVFGWIPFLVWGALLAAWLMLKYTVIGIYWTLKALGWLALNIVIPGIVILAVCLYFAWFRWVLPWLRPQAPKKAVDHPAWRGWTPPQ